MEQNGGFLAQSSNGFCNIIETTIMVNIHALSL